MKVAVLIGSMKDLPVAEQTIKTLKHFGIPFDARVMSAHRSPDIVSDFARNAKKNGYEVIIAAAGKSAHLAGVIASYTPLPVIGLPVRSTLLDGLDSLLSIVQMPDHVPVATVGVNSSVNAALLAVQILALKYPELGEKLAEYKINVQNNLVAANEQLMEELAHM